MELGPVRDRLRGHGIIKKVSRLFRKLLQHYRNRKSKKTARKYQDRGKKGLSTFGVGGSLQAFLGGSITCCFLDEHGNSRRILLKELISDISYCKAAAVKIQS